MASREQRLAIVVVAKDLASATLKGINSQLARMAGGRSPLGQVAGGVGTLTAGFVRLGVVGAAAAIGGLTAAAKAGIAFEDAFAGVRKTVEGGPAELDALYESLRNLSNRIPVSFVDLAGIAQEAGALGVPTQNIAAFTEAVARVTAATVGLDEATASEAFGKLGSLFNLQGTDYERLGSVLVDLGNNAASTEVDIIEVAKRFGGAGRAAGLSVPQILGWSSAIASLGPLAEAGGSSLVRMFQRVIQYAGTGDKKFAAFAKSAGMSEAAFKSLLGSDPSSAMAKFIGGLKTLDKFQLASTLKAAGITNVRDIQAIQALAQNTDLLTESNKRANDAWQKNTALTEISAKRFNTLKSHLTQFRNQILNAAVTIAAGMNPAIDRATQKLGAFLALPQTQHDLVGLGKDIGAAIDKINWSKVIDGAKTLVGIIKSAIELIGKIPPEITAGIIGFAAVNKVSGGLIGKGAGDIIGGTLRAGIGQFFGRGSAGNPMWVRMAGGIGGAGTGGGSSKLGNVVAAVTIVGSAFAVWQEWKNQNDSNSAIATGLTDQTNAWLAQQPKKEDLERGLAGVQQGIDDIRSNPLNVLVQGDALNKLEAMKADIQAQLAKLDAINASVQNIHITAGVLSGLTPSPQVAHTPGLNYPTSSSPIHRFGGPQAGDGSNVKSVNLFVKTSISPRENNRAMLSWRRNGNGSVVTID